MSTTSGSAQAAAAPSAHSLATAAARPRVGMPTMVLYGTGFISNSVKTRGLATFLMVFYNQVMGLPAAWVGLGTGLALIFDALIDPAVGYVSDNTQTRWGRRHPFMYAAAAPVAILFFLLWNPPTGLEPSFSNGFHVPTGVSRNGAEAVDRHASPLKLPASDAIVNCPRLLHASSGGPKSSSVASSSSPAG